MHHSPLSAQNNSYIVSVPMDGVEMSEDGRYRIIINEQRRVVAYHVELASWVLLKSSPVGMVPDVRVSFGGSGRWQVGSANTSDGRPKTRSSRWSKVVLPPVVDTPLRARPIPRTIHYIWIGDSGMPEHLVRTVLQNACHCSDYHVRIHTHTSTLSGLQRLQTQFASQPSIEVVNLFCEPHFAIFQNSTIGRFYRYFVNEKWRNYGAASDILRLHILHREGGIYMDVDDKIKGKIHPNFYLYAGPDDILLNRMVEVEKYNFDGFPNSNFATHAGNRVIEGMLDEMSRRLCAGKSFFKFPRPWIRTSNKNQENRTIMLDYIKTIFELTGPTLFNDVLLQLRPDYYDIIPALLRAYEATAVAHTEPRILAYDYFERMHTAKKFYLPFCENTFDVEIGSAHSWNPVRP